ncbi:hypothetical protein ADUPG1_001471, partial [Aduncisulcus paluster]
MLCEDSTHSRREFVNLLTYLGNINHSCKSFLSQHVNNNNASKCPSLSSSSRSSSSSSSSSSSRSHKQRWNVGDNEQDLKDIFDADCPCYQTPCDTHLSICESLKCFLNTIKVLNYQSTMTFTHMFSTSVRVLSDPSKSLSLHSSVTKCLVHTLISRSVCQTIKDTLSIRLLPLI